ncbi:MAG: homoserine kinase [Chloroflexota bacterium]
MDSKLFNFLYGTLIFISIFLKPQIFSKYNRSTLAPFLTLSTNKIHTILGEYGLIPTSFEPIQQGLGNSNFLVDSNKGRFILTVFEIDHNRVVNLSRLLTLLVSRDFPTAGARTQSGGEKVLSVDGHSAMLKPYVPGQVIEDLNGHHLQQIGEAVAQLHRIPAPDYLPVQHAYELETFPVILGNHEYHEFGSWLEQRLEIFRQALPPGLPRGLIHGDVFFDNVIFDNDTLRAIIDFEEACHYYLVFDLGMAALGLCTQDMKLNLPQVRALLDGYQRIRPLVEVEKQALQLFVEYAAITTSSWRFWKYNIDTPNIAKSDLFVQMVEISQNVGAVPGSIFYDTVINQQLDE